LKKLKGKLYTLKRSLLKIALGLCLLTTVPFTATSQDTSRITITSDQLRTTNIIFAEHDKYSKLIPLLQQENAQLIEVNETWERTDSLKTVQLSHQNQIMMQQNQDMERLKKNLRISNTVGGTAVGVSIIVTVLCLLLN
jgi:hypothetical protein